MCHALEKVLQLALGTFTKSENFKHKLEKLVTQTSQLTGQYTQYPFQINR